MSSERFALLVVKFGGTSLASPPRVRRAAAQLERLKAQGHQVVAVVSAAAGTTDQILAWHSDVTNGGTPDREADRALATGELLSAALLAAALNVRGIRARSFSGGEAGLLADGTCGAGRLVGLDAAPLRAALTAGVLPVVAGFQAVLRYSGETVTLGRGASDLSAVFLAAHLRAAECLIVTDVDGVYTHDPRAGGRPARFSRLSHDRLCELAAGGAKVVQVVAAEVARDHAVRLRICHYRSRLDRPAGTTVEAIDPGDDLAVSA